MSDSRSFDEKRMQTEMQLDLLKTYIENRRQTVINVGVGSIAMIALSANFITPNTMLKTGITMLVCFLLFTFWYDAYIHRLAMEKSQNLLNQILGEQFAGDAEKIKNRSSWFAQNYTEIIVTIFTIIVIYFLILLFATGNSTAPIKPTDQFRSNNAYCGNVLHKSYFLH